MNSTPLPVRINSNMLWDDKYSDFTITCRGLIFKIHRSTLSKHSEVLTKEFDSDMKEKRTGNIDHKEFDVDTVERMITFAYEGEYNVDRKPKPLPYGQSDADYDKKLAELESEAVAEDGTEGVPLLQESSAEGAAQEGLTAVDEWIIHARVYAIADYYDMPELHTFALDQFITVGDKVDAVDLEGFIDLVHDVCTRTSNDDNHPLRHALLSLTSRYAPQLAQDAEFLDSLKQTPALQEFSADMFAFHTKKMADDRASTKRLIKSLPNDNVACEERLWDLKISTDSLVEAARAETQEAKRQLESNSADAQVTAAKAEARAARDQLDEIEGVTRRLIQSLGSLPAACANNMCDREFGKLRFEQKRNGD